MAERSRNISTTIFLLAIFVFLAVFVGGWIYRVYTTQSAYSTDQSASAVKCTSYAFDVDKSTLIYENGVLVFEFQYNYGDAITTLVVESGTEMREIQTKDLVSGMTQQLHVTIPLAEEVRIYPKGCRDNNYRLFKTTG